MEGGDADDDTDGGGVSRTFTSVSCGAAHTVAVTAEGALLAWWGGAKQTTTPA